KAAFYREARMLGGKVETGLTVLELLANLADDHPFIALAGQQWAQAFFADAIGRRSVDQIDAKFASQRQQLPGLLVVGNGEAIGVLHALVSAQLDGAQA